MLVLRVGNKPQPAWSVSTMWKPARSCFVDFNKLPTIIKLMLWKKEVCVARLNLGVVQFVSVTVVNLAWSWKMEKGGAVTVRSFCSTVAFHYITSSSLWKRNGDGKKVNSVRENCTRLTAVYITDGCNTIQPDTMTRHTLCLYSRHVADAVLPHTDLQWVGKITVLSTGNVRIVICHWEIVTLEL